MSSFVVSHRLAGRNTRATRDRMRSVVPQLEYHTEVARMDVEGEHPCCRSVGIVECESCEELAKLSKGWHDDVLVEPLFERSIARKVPGYLRSVVEQQGAQPLASGMGHAMTLEVRSRNQPISDVAVTVVLVARSNPSQQTRVERTTDSSGRVTIDYDDRHWQPLVAVSIPHQGHWGWMHYYPRNGAVLTVEPLPRGQLGYWHYLIGMNRIEPGRGAGVKVGIADTGIAAHPYLTNVRRLGAISNGTYNSDPKATEDVEGHGTHVSGIIGAQPPPGSDNYVGIANAADIGMLRVFGPGGTGASQGDIALAIDILAQEQQVDFINLSLSGSMASEIELDAILAAIEVGTLCVAAAGNASGQPVTYPAAFPQVVAVSAMGLYGQGPHGSIAASYIPTQPQQWGPDGLFLATFSNVGPQLVATAPGVGVISTVPPIPGHDAPYMEMSGTSMATPVTVAALASLLASDPQYLKLPRSPVRAQWAGQTLLHSLTRLPLVQPFVGYGLSRSLP